MQLVVQEQGSAARRVLLDSAALGAGNALQAATPSADGRHLAYVVGKAGADWGEIRLRHVHTVSDLPEVLPNVRFDGPMEWTADGTSCCIAASHRRATASWKRRRKMRRCTPSQLNDNDRRFPSRFPGLLVMPV